MESPDKPRTHSVTWTDIHKDTKELARRLSSKGPWAGIAAITRGGMVPAAILARELNIRLIDTICIVSYGADTDDGAEQQGLKILKPGLAADGTDGTGWLVIDDLVDTGTTIRKVRQMLPNAHFATIYAKPLARDLVDTTVGEVPQDVWIYFPWDTEPQFIRPIIDDE